TFPFLPFLILASACVINRVAAKAKSWSLILTVIALAIQAAEGLAIAKAFAAVNTREQASEWLLSHVSPGTEIGIIRSYYWTAPILRTHQSPFKVIKGGDDRSRLDEALAGWLNRDLPPYFVLSDIEYRDFLKSPASSPQRKALDRIFDNVEQVASFAYRPNFFGIPCWWRNPPFDLEYIAPDQRIFRRRESSR
ncbi:MAG: hypothetical protein AAB091_01865, partial [Elusimicrobiota bacterium]